MAYRAAGSGALAASGRRAGHRVGGATRRPGVVPAGRADVRGADVRGADLRGADVRGADVRGADLRGAGGARLLRRVLGGQLHGGEPDHRPVGEAVPGR
ncbi:pentapeptide repeat-containing protein [Micromonospora sp. CPCC 205547]|uniref:pentapeptide repeat-containing protein n=1 Tax=Micromonospora sp. CPCC 205547 TaxID=3122400 RepID=UPI003B967EBE